MSNILEMLKKEVVANLKLLLQRFCTGIVDKER